MSLKEEHEKEEEVDLFHGGHIEGEKVCIFGGRFRILRGNERYFGGKVWVWFLFFWDKG